MQFSPPKKQSDIKTNLLWLSVLSRLLKGSIHFCFRLHAVISEAFRHQLNSSLIKHLGGSSPFSGCYSDRFDCFICPFLRCKCKCLLHESYHYSLTWLFPLYLEMIHKAVWCKLCPLGRTVNTFCAVFLFFATCILIFCIIFSLV